MRIVLPIFFLFFFIPPLHALARYDVKSEVVLNNWRGEAIRVDRDWELSFEIVSSEKDRTTLEIYNWKGEYVGEYDISNADLEKVLGKSIQAGFEKIPVGPENKENCCDVVTPKKEISTNVDQGKPVPIPTPRPDPKKKPEVVTEKEVPIPTPRPDYTPDSPAQQNPTGACKYFRSFLKKGVPEIALKQALSYYTSSRGQRFIKKERYITIADYSKNSVNKRFYLLDMQTGEVTSEKVSHGGSGEKYGDPNHDGFLDQCKRPNGSRLNLTRAGFFTTGVMGYSAGKTWPKHKNNNQRINFLSLVSRSPGVNDDTSGYVMHEATYNHNGRSIMGRSHGCPAFVPDKGYLLWKKIAGGSLYYSYAPVCDSDYQRVKRQVSGWESICK